MCCGLDLTERNLERVCDVVEAEIGQVVDTGLDNITQLLTAVAVDVASHD
jgi:hypothetical protein